LPIGLDFTLDDLIADVEKDGRLLSFRDVDHFRETATKLEALNDARIDEMNVRFADLSDEEYDVKMEELNFHDHGVYIQFEAGLGHNSRRASIESKIEQWLDTDQEIDWDANPDRSDDLSSAERCLVSERGILIIDGVEMNLVSGTRTQCVSGSDCNSSDFVGCSRNTEFTQRSYIFNDGNNRINYEFKTWTCGFPRYQTGTYMQVKGKIVHFSKRGRRRWKRTRRSLGVEIRGKYDNNTTPPSCASGEVDGVRYYTETKYRRGTECKVSFFDSFSIQESFAYYCDEQEGKFYVDGQLLRTINH